jgi:hypothetical protein
VLQLADRPTQFHLDVLGPLPTGTAGRAVWCHQANRLERRLATPCQLTRLGAEQAIPPWAERRRTRR